MWLVCRDLIENIYSREVSDEYRRRCAETRGSAWTSGAIPEVFLDKVVGEDQHDSVLLPLTARLPAAFAVSAYAISIRQMLYWLYIACMHSWLLHAVDHSHVQCAVGTAVSSITGTD